MMPTNLWTTVVAGVLAVAVGCGDTATPDETIPPSARATLPATGSSRSPVTETRRWRPIQPFSATWDSFSRLPRGTIRTWEATS
jgi:hypothetical protein